MLHARVIRPDDLRRAHRVRRRLGGAPGGRVRADRAQGRFPRRRRAQRMGGDQGGAGVRVTGPPARGCPNRRRCSRPGASARSPRRTSPRTSAMPRRRSTASARRVKATYDFAVQTHATIGPSCAVADFKDGKLTVWTSSQATHSMQHELAVDHRPAARSDPPGLHRGRGLLRPQRHRGCRRGRRADRDASSASRCGCNGRGRTKPRARRRARRAPWTWRPGLDAQGNVVAWTGDFYIALNHIVAFKPLDFPLLAASRDRHSAARQLGRLPVPELRAALPVSEHAGEHAAHRRDVLPLLAPAQPGADREQLRQRGLHGRARGGGECRSGGIPPALPQGSARDRRRAGRHEAGGLAGAARTESERGQRAGREGARHLVPALQQRDHLRGGGGRSRGEQGRRARSASPACAPATIAARWSTRTASRTRSKAACCKR